MNNLDRITLERTELDQMQLKIVDIVFRWTRADTPIIPSMKDSMFRVTKDDKLREYLWEKLRPKFF